MKDSSIINLEKKRVRQYGELFFRRNPFPSTAIPEKVPALNVDREETIQYFKDTMFALADSPTPFVTVLIGEYGDGKTHLLNLFRHSINSQLLRFDENVESTMAIYVRTPGKNFKEFFGEILEDIGRTTLEAVSNKILNDYINENRSAVEKYVVGNVKKIPPKFELADFLRESYALEFFKNVRSNVFSNIEDSDIVFPFLFLSHPDFSSLAWRWFLGEKLSSTEKERLKVGSSIENKEKAYKQYKNLLAVLRLVKINSIVLLVDELEKILFIGGLQKGQFYDDLRHLIDDSPEGTAYFFAIAPTQWNDLTKEPFALIRRLSENILTLDRFDQKRTRDLIVEYLQYSRIKEKESEIKSKFSECKPDAAPFTEEAIKAIFEVREGNVFSTLVLCRKLIDRCIDNIQKSNIITPEMVQELAGPKIIE